jgi:hypothetical protein
LEGVSPFTGDSRKFESAINHWLEEVEKQVNGIEDQV